jgi:hypothetical protein
MKSPKKSNKSEVLKTNLTFEDLMKKALNTPLPKKVKKAKKK